ncbi:MAG TPA: hypothetical protein PLG88_06345 [Chitinophagaceae bacterium]|nr:hypothetical protein [Chitinophagaceae bacterium]MCB0740232.1 hypothetical protein [Chitinophagaceae bacterium]HQU57029.1 hypothetical protein [Chitinophagaceae bacterium]HQV05460.1 hypothetical protein [Chitinophagaceae bacterium]
MNLQPDTEFEVKEEKALVYVLAFACLALCIYAIIHFLLIGLKKQEYTQLLYALVIIPAIYFFRKAKQNTVYIRINKTGIYERENLVTTWPYFLNAYINQKKKTISIQDNFVLVIEHLKPNNTSGFRKKIALTNTQNKSEEDIMTAIIYFWKIYKAKK